MSTPEEIMYLDAIGAMRASLSSATTKEQRAHVDHFLAQLKEDRRCLEIMTHVLTVQSENHDDYIRMMSLTILNDWLKIWWNKLSESDHAAIRNTVLMLLSGPVGKSPVKGLWTKLSVMISNIAVRQYPQMWPSFLDDMVSMCVSSSTTRTFGEQEIAIMVIEFTASDCIDNDYCNSLPIQRRQDILAGFRKKLPDLLRFSYTYLIECMRQYRAIREGQTPYGPEREVFQKDFLRLMGGIVRMLIPIAMFAKAEDMCEPSRDLSVLAIQLLCEPELQSDAVEFLDILTRHKLPFDVFAKLVDVIPRLSSSLLQPVPPATSGGESLPIDAYDSLTFQRSYAEMVSNVLSMNISTAMDRHYLSSPQAQESLGKYVTLMVNLISQHSWKLPLEMINGWTKIFREDSITNLPWLSDVCEELLKVYLSKSERILWEKERPSRRDQEGISLTPIDEIASMEFENYDEWLDYSGAVKTQMISLAAVLAQKLPVICVGFLQNRASILLSMPSSAYIGDANDAEDVRRWQAFGSFFDIFAVELLLPSTESSSSGSHGIDGQNLKRRLVVELCTIVESILTWSPTPQSALHLLRLQLLQNCAPVLKVAPSEMLQRTFADLFRHDTPGNAVDPRSFVSPMVLSEKATAVVAHLCHTCGESVVSDTTLLNAIVSQILNMINYRKAQVPSTPIELKSLQNQRGCLRESLVALSERLTQLPSQQKELLVMSLADVVASWQGICNLEGGKSFFTTPQTLLDACHQNHVDISRSKDDMGVLLSSCKRVSCASLPENVWAVDNHATSFNLPSLVAMVDRALPFLAVWQAIMPGMCVSIKTLHGVLDPAMRCSLSGSSFSALYMPPITMVRRAAGLLQPSNEEPQGDLNKIVQALPGAEEAMAVGRHISEMRVLLYQLLGQACSHKALYVCVEHSAIIADLSAMLPWLENYQLSQLMKIFVESYVLNAPPIVHDIVAGFLESFLGTTFRRLSVCWSDVGAGAGVGGGTAEDEAAVLQRVIYRECNIPPDFGGFDSNQLENAKKTLWSELTRTYSEILSALACCKGYLAIDMPTTAALQSATMLGIAATVAPDASRGVIGRGGKGKGKGKGPGAGAGAGAGAKVDTKPLDGIAFESTAPSSTDTELQLKQHKVLRRTALNSLLMSNPRYQQAVTAPFVASTVSLIGIPDTMVSRKGLLLAGTLALKCREDRRLITAVGKDAFSAALSVLLQQEAWSDGIEPEVIEFLTTVYELLVFGEILGPDGSILTPPASASSSSLDSQNGKNNSKKVGPGFGSMSQWSGPGRGTGPGGRSSDMSSSGSSGHNGKDAAMLSDLPRKILLMVQTISPHMVESLETQLLGTASKKKRRDFLKEFLKNAGVGRGSAVPEGKRIEASVRDIRQRMVPQLGRKKTFAFDTTGKLSGGVSAVDSLEAELNLSSFFGD